MNQYYKKHYNERRAYGIKKEEELLPKLKQQFDETLIKSSFRYDKFDYYGEKYIIELKSRRINHNKFETTLINKHKCEYADKNFKDKKVIFCFHFIDNVILYIDYDKELFDTFKIQKTTSHTYSGERINYEIPISMMKSI